MSLPVYVRPAWPNDELSNIGYGKRARQIRPSPREIFVEQAIATPPPSLRSAAGVQSDMPRSDYRSALKRAIITLPTSSMAAETSLLQAAGSTVTW